MLEMFPLYLLLTYYVFDGIYVSSDQPNSYRHLAATRVYLFDHDIVLEIAKEEKTITIPYLLPRYPT